MNDENPATPLSPEEPPSPEEALAMYQNLVNGNATAIPMLLWSNGEDLAVIGLPETPNGMQDMLARVLPYGIENFGHPTWLMLSAEAWAKPFKSREEMEAVAGTPGSLGELKEAGDEEVTEVVMLTAVSLTKSWSSITPFKRTLDGVDYEESKVLPAEGGVPDLLLQAVR